MNTQDAGTQNDTGTQNDAATDLRVELLDLSAKLNMKAIAVKLNEVIEAINALEKPTSSRGPKSKHEMTEKHAEMILSGEHKDLSHKDAAAALELSYGQVYSARNGYTFKAVYRKAQKAAEAAAVTAALEAAEE